MLWGHKQPLHLDELPCPAHKPSLAEARKDQGAECQPAQLESFVGAPAVCLVVSRILGAEQEGGSQTSLFHGLPPPAQGTMPMIGQPAFLWGPAPRGVWGTAHMPESQFQTEPGHSHAPLGVPFVLREAAWFVVSLWTVPQVSGFRSHLHSCWLCDPEPAT